MSATALAIVPECEDEILGERERDRDIDYDRFVEKFTDPRTKDLAIALSLRDLRSALSIHVEAQEELIQTILCRFNKLEEKHHADTRSFEERLRVVERVHERELAVKDTDTARLVWFNRVFGGVIGSLLLALAYWFESYLIGRGGR